MQLGFAGTGVPGAGEGAVRVAEVGEVVALVGAGGGGGPCGGGVGQDLAAEGGEDARYCLSCIWCLVFSIPGFGCYGTGWLGLIGMKRWR